MIGYGEEKNYFEIMAFFEFQLMNTQKNTSLSADPFLIGRKRPEIQNNFSCSMPYYTPNPGITCFRISSY